MGVSRIILEAIELKPGSTYEAKLRVQMATQEDEMPENRYEGQWSEWSQPVWFPSPQRQGVLPCCCPLRLWAESSHSGPSLPPSKSSPYKVPSFSNWTQGLLYYSCSLRFAHFWSLVTHTLNS